MWETWVQSLGWEDPLEKEMVTHSSILAWKIPWTEEPAWAILHRVAKSWTRLSDFTSFQRCPGERRKSLHGIEDRVQDPVTVGKGTRKMSLESFFFITRKGAGITLCELHREKV